MRGRGAAWVLALVLLAGCAPAPAAEPPADKPAEPQQEAPHADAD